MSGEWNGDEAKRIYFAAAQAAVNLGAELLLTEANKTVPIEETTLGRSGQVSTDTSRTRTRNAVANVSYDTPYAKRQHEDRTLKHDPGRRAKWLEFTLDENRRKISGLLADEIRKRVP
jgi:hypothetical protein